MDGSETSGRDIVVVGASAGGVEALRALVRGLPADLPAAVFVVLHVSPNGTSLLPDILARDGALPVAHAVDGEPIQPGRVYVAPPDQHLLVKAGFVRLVRGPKENRQRPAVDPLFRSAARVYGPRVVGVVLSGSLDDGTSGLAAVRYCGGMGIAQDPADALFPSMPRSAIEQVGVDRVLAAEAIGAELARLAAEPVAPREASNGSRGSNGLREIDQEIAMVEADPAAIGGDSHPGTLSGFGCPECGGSLWERQDGKLIRFRCRVGHAFSVGSLLAEQAEQLEDALWSALRALEEQAALHRRLAERAGANRQGAAEARFRGHEQDAASRAETIRAVLLDGRRDPAVAEAGNGRGAAVGAAR